MWIMDIEMPVIAAKIILDLGLAECSNRRPLFEQAIENKAGTILDQLIQ